MFSPLKLRIRTEMISKFLLTLISVAYGYNLIKSKLGMYERTAGMIIIVIGLYWMFNRDYYLPFLGKCAMPPSLIQEASQVKVDGKVPVRLTGLPPNTQILYWAANTVIANNKDVLGPKEAYGITYKNSGVTFSNELGEAFARVDCPSNYSVGLLKMQLSKHIHYRYALPEYPGLYSPVFTADIEC